MAERVPDDRFGRSQAPPVEVPHDVVNEQILIAAVLTDEAMRQALGKKVPADLFVDPKHAAIWSAMQGMIRSQLTWSIQTLHQRVASVGVDIGYLTELMRAYPSTPGNVDHHLSILRWDHARAESVRGPVTDLLKSLQDPTTPPERIKALGRSVASSYEVHVDRGFMRDPRLLARSAGMSLRDRAEMAVFPYGISGLDADEDGKHLMTPGAAPKQISLITGVSGSGKSVLAACIALEQARRRRRVLYGAWEMGAETTIELLAIMSLGLSRYNIVTGNVSVDDVVRMEKRMVAIGSYVRFFDPPFSGDYRRRYDNHAALDVIHGNVEDSGAEVAIFDLWERAIPDSTPDQERHALWRQQQIAKETDTHCILVCEQKIKEIEMRSDKRPTRSTILGSGAWVDIADTILSTHRPAQWKAMSDNVMEIGVLKQRYGRWPLAVECEWDGDKCTLLNGRVVEYSAPSSLREAGSAISKIGKGKVSR